MVQLSQALGLELMPGTTREIESLESVLLGLPQVKYTLASHFADGVWVRELRVPRGSLIVGHEHRHENLNIMAQGAKLVVIGEVVQRMQAPYCVFSGPGIRKVGLILEDMVWYSIHHNPTNERDEQKLEEMFYRKSPTFINHEMARTAETKLKDLRHLLPDFSKPSTISPL